MLKLSPLCSNYFDDVVAFICRRYAELRAFAPLLPERYEEYEVVAPLLESILDQAPGVVALDDSRLVGFIGGWLLPDFRGQRAVISPEWGNATCRENSRRIYEAMYAYTADKWLEQGFYTHVVCLYADRPTDIETWHWLGFGMAAADGVRDLQPLDLDTSPYDIKRAGVDDLQDLYDLGRALSQHIADTPTYLLNEDPQQVEELRDLLTDQQHIFWLASRRGQAVGFLRHGPASEEASTIIRDPGTTSIKGLYTIPKERGRGIAAYLLNKALFWSKTQDYDRCCVDFEPMNVLAARFWTRYFKIVSFALLRTIDPRIRRE
jgi:GNAT superfamily N-acetyltransferase